jgi:hypothetical protein
VKTKLLRQKSQRSLLGAVADYQESRTVLSHRDRVGRLEEEVVTLLGAQACEDPYHHIIGSEAEA